MKETNVGHVLVCKCNTINVDHCDSMTGAVFSQADSRFTEILQLAENLARTGNRSSPAGRHGQENRYNYVCGSTLMEETINILSDWTEQSMVSLTTYIFFSF